MKIVHSILNLGAVVLAAGVSFGQSRPSADLIIVNAKVWTVDSSRPTAEAVAIIADRIAAVGTTSEIEAWRGTATRLIDAQGKLLVPGFNDAHVHFISGGLQLDSVDLKDAATPQEFAARIEARAKVTPKDEWIEGGDWDEQRFNPPQLPAKELIDPVTPNTPVFVTRYDGHISLANSLTLKLAGITAKTPDPPGGVIVRDKNGEATGVLKDAAQSLVSRVEPRLTLYRRMRAAKRALAHAASLGVTSVQDMAVDYADVAVYTELLSRRELTARIYVAPMLENWEDQARIGLQRAWGSSYLRYGALKTFADGSLGATTAYFFQPYTDAPNSYGILSSELQDIPREQERIQKADAAGLQICAHAIGDRGISTMLDIMSEVEKANGDKDRRFRIEHAQHMSEKDFDRFAKLKVIASVQPYHAIDDGRFAERRIGPERIKTTYAFRTFLDHGVRLAFGTDWDVAPLSPMWTVYAAVTRATLDDKNPTGWVPEQRLSVAEAVQAYTMGSAYAEFQDREKGSITVGKLADMVLLSDDIFTIEPTRIKDVSVLVTVVGGKVVFQK